MHPTLHFKNIVSLETLQSTCKEVPVLLCMVCVAPCLCEILFFSLESQCTCTLPRARRTRSFSGRVRVAEKTNVWMKGATDTSDSSAGLPFSPSLPSSPSPEGTASAASSASSLEFVRRPAPYFLRSLSMYPKMLVSSYGTKTSRFKKMSDAA